MKILFICTHNRCRSIICEAVSRQLADGAIEARSAGSQPAGQVHPLTLKYLKEAGYSVDDLVSQSWDEFDAFAPDLVITVCDSAANESCPLWFGKALKIHWGLKDPSKIEGGEEIKRQAFLETINETRRRVLQLAELAHRPNAEWPALLESFGASL